MTHLGLISAVAASEKGYQVLCFDPDVNLINSLRRYEPLISEPQLIELMIKNKELISYSSHSKILENIPLIYIAPDVSTDDQGNSDLREIDRLLNIVLENTSKNNVIVILSQVPPGFTRNRHQKNRAIYYQVETLIFGQAISRALTPERYIVGSSNPNEALPEIYNKFLASHKCPILIMRYESAELAKISINMCLVASISTANTLAELCEKIGADWAEIVPALKLDKRIGQYAYLSPGLGISGGNLERDLATVINYTSKNATDCGVVKAWVENSKRRKNWIWEIFEKLGIENIREKNIGLLGLTYKENTNSLKNSPALALLSKINGWNVVAYDPLASMSAVPAEVKRANSILEVIKSAEILVIATAWQEFKAINAKLIIENNNCKVIIDPYGLLDGKTIISNEIDYYTLGVSSIIM